MERVVPYILLIALAINACAPTAYAPVGNVQNVPLLSDSSTTRASVNFGSNGFNINLANVLSHKSRIMINLTNINREQNSYCEECERTRRSIYELAWGRLISNKEDFVFEFFVGGGYGKSDVLTHKVNYFNIYSSHTDQVMEKATFIQPFIQFDCGERDEKLEIAYSIKTVAPYFLSYTHISNPGEDNESITHYNGSWIIFLQPAITTRWGFKNFKGQFQIGLSAPLIAREYAKFSVFASVGLTLNN